MKNEEQSECEEEEVKLESKKLNFHLELEFLTLEMLVFNIILKHVN